MENPSSQSSKGQAFIKRIGSVKEKWAKFKFPISIGIGLFIVIGLVFWLTYKHANQPDLSKEITIKTPAGFDSSRVVVKPIIPKKDTVIHRKDDSNPKPVVNKTPKDVTVPVKPPPLTETEKRKRARDSIVANAMDH